MRGFTLVELAVVLAIVGLLLGALLRPMAGQILARQNKETDGFLDEIDQALMGYVVSFGRLPCPDTDGDGIEDFNPPPDCAAVDGLLPSTSLGVAREDAWGQRFIYSVTQEFTYPVITGAPPGPLQLDVTDVGDITINTPLPTFGAAAVISAGADRTFDAENADGDAQLITAQLTNGIDDKIIWLTHPAIMYRLLQVNKWP